jgi:hypothetical protein
VETAVAPRTGSARLSIAVVVFLLVGFGLGWLQGSVRAGAAEEQLRAVREELKTARDGLAKVDARANRMEARCHLNLAEKAAASGDLRECTVRVRQAVNLLRAGSRPRDRELTSAAEEIPLQAAPEALRAGIRKVAEQLDRDLPIGAALSGGGGQGVGVNR